MSEMFLPLIHALWVSLSDSCVCIYFVDFLCFLALQFKYLKIYEWLWEELLHVDLLWRIQNLGQDVFGDDVGEKRWRCGVPARGIYV